MKGYRRARKRVPVSVGESVRIVRELQGLENPLCVLRQWIQTVKWLQPARFLPQP